MFDEWNKGELDSFLIEITANILRFKDEKGEFTVPKILDTAGQVTRNSNDKFMINDLEGYWQMDWNYGT